MTQAHCLFVKLMPLLFQLLFKGGTGLLAGSQLLLETINTISITF
jgi:hypothetical protein